MRKITREHSLKELPEKCKWFFDNWKPFNCYRSTLLALLQRWYDTEKNDKIKFAFID